MFSSSRRLSLEDYVLSQEIETSSSMMEEYKQVRMMNKQHVELLELIVHDHDELVLEQ